MSRPTTILFRTLLILAFFTLAPRLSNAQGRVVINEFMPWPGTSCVTTSEFVELLNFGPGPINIGCYILTNGNYSISIPAGTILQPGQYYVIAGRNSIPAGCGNIDSTIRVHLNWNTCGCTSAPIPTTGDGFMEDGGNANVKLVLLDPQLKVVDAISRTLPPSGNTTITTNNPIGGCQNVTFNLDNLNVTYETVGISTGNSNSFARTTDGDCGWVKDPQQSAGATNTRAGEIINSQFSFYYVKASGCNNDGAVAVSVTGDPTGVLPVSYILAKDSDNSGTFDMTDQYTSVIGVNSTTIDINNLSPGNYRLTVSSASGCFLRTFPFNLTACAVVTLPLTLHNFQATRQNEDVRFNWKIEEANLLEEVILEGSSNSHNFQALRVLPVPTGIPTDWINQIQFPVSSDIRFVRLKMITHMQEQSWSKTIQLSNGPERGADRIYPNPTNGHVQMETEFQQAGTTEIRVLSQSGQVLRQFRQPVQSGLNRIQMNLTDLPGGFYIIQLSDPGKMPSKTFRISKQG